MRVQALINIFYKYTTPQRHIYKQQGYIVYPVNEYENSSIVGCLLANNKCSPTYRVAQYNRKYIHKSLHTHVRARINLNITLNRPKYTFAHRLHTVDL